MPESPNMMTALQYQAVIATPYHQLQLAKPHYSQHTSQGTTQTLQTPQITAHTPRTNIPLCYTTVIYNTIDHQSKRYETPWKCRYTAPSGVGATRITSLST